MHSTEDGSDMELTDIEASDVIEINRADYDALISQMYFNLIQQNFNENIAFEAASKYPTDFNEAIKYINSVNKIEIPITIECKRNTDYECSFTLPVPYSKHFKYSLKDVIKDIMQRIHTKYHPVKFIAKTIDESSFVGRELNDTDEDWRSWDGDGEFITDYSEQDIINKGLKISNEIAIFEHKIKSLDYTCEHALVNSNDNTKEELKMNFDPFACPIYSQMKEEYKFDEKNLLHLQQYNHYRNEYIDKPKCKYGDKCRTFIRMVKGGNELKDKCHMAVFRHPPRNRKVDIQSNINAFRSNEEFKENEQLYSPTSDDKKEYNEKDGYLDLLIKEVINNKFEKDLCLTDNELKNHNHSIMNVVNEKLNCDRHRQMGSPLNKAEILAVILYTGGDANYDLCKSQRAGDYSKWKWFDYCLYWAIAKLTKREQGRYKVYTGLRGTKITKKRIKCGYFTTYVSTSWIKAIAVEFADKTGMLVEIDENFRETSDCCDVSWISKFPDECEVIIARSIDAVKNNFECNVVDNKNGMQTVLLSKYSPDIIKHIPSMVKKSYNAVHADDSGAIEYNASMHEKQQMIKIRERRLQEKGLDALPKTHLNDGLSDEKVNDGLSDEKNEPLILISSDLREFEIGVRAALLSNLVRAILKSDTTGKEVPINKVRGDILELIVTYLKHHNGKKPKEIAKPIRSVKMERIVDKWDADYINKMNKKTIFQVILAANYMDIASLLHLGCTKISTLIKGKSPEEIKTILADDSNDNKQEENKDDQ